MNKLEVENKTLTSIEVAGMVDKEHKNLIRDIKLYISQIQEVGELKIELGDFFLESSYKTNQNKEQPCYLITKKRL